MQPVFFCDRSRTEAGGNKRKHGAIKGGIGRTRRARRARSASTRDAQACGLDRKRSGGAGVVRSAQFLIGQQPHLYLRA